MSQRYGDPDKIPGEDIQKAWTEAETIRFSARRFNSVKYRYVGFGDLGWWLPLSRVLPLVGITPQMLRPIFNPQICLVKRKFPFNRRWLGLNKKCYKIVEVEVPEDVESYDRLGTFPLAEEPFKNLAKIFGKSIVVMQEDGGTGEHYHLYTALPSGKIIEHIAKAA